MKLAGLQDAQASDSALAKWLGVKKTTLSSWRRRGSIPIWHCINAARKSSVDLNYIISGDKNDGPTFKLSLDRFINSEFDLLSIALRHAIKEFQSVGFGDSVDDLLQHYRLLAAAMMREYENSIDLMRSVSQNKHMEMADFIAKVAEAEGIKNWKSIKELYNEDGQQKK